MMKSAILFLSAALVAGAAMPSHAAAQEDADRKGVEQAVRYYFTGGDEHDLESMKKAFHPDAKMLFIKDGVLTQVTMPEWFERIKNAPPGGPKASSRKIVSIDISGNA